MVIENEFEIQDIVYLRHDIEQHPRMVTAIIWDGHKIMYEVISGTQPSNNYYY